MAGVCRFVGGACLVLATVMWAGKVYAAAASGAVLALVWLLAGQLAAVIGRANPRE